MSLIIQYFFYVFIISVIIANFLLKDCYIFYSIKLSKVFIITYAIHSIKCYIFYLENAKMSNYFTNFLINVDMMNDY